MVAANKGGLYPCLDENRRYRSFPCSECQALRCWAGAKPNSVSPGPVLRPGEKACQVCGTPYTYYGKSKYCSDDCRRKATYRQRRYRRHREGIGIY